MAPPMPRLKGWRITIAPSASATATVRSTRAVVDDDDVEVGRAALDVADDAADHVLLVERGDDREQPEFSIVLLHGAIAKNPRTDPGIGTQRVAALRAAARG